MGSSFAERSVEFSGVRRFLILRIKSAIAQEISPEAH